MKKKFDWTRIKTGTKLRVINVDDLTYSLRLKMKVNDIVTFIKTYELTEPIHHVNVYIDKYRVYQNGLIKERFEPIENYRKQKLKLP